MTSRLGWYYRQRRLRLGLTVEALAVRLRYRKVKKGAHRITRFEYTGHAPDALLANLADALGIDYGTTLDLMERDARQPALAAVENRVHHALLFPDSPEATATMLTPRAPKGWLLGCVRPPEPKNKDFRRLSSPKPPSL